LPRVEERAEKRDSGGGRERSEEEMRN
jgi:hypothetical protein